MWITSQINAKVQVCIYIFVAILKLIEVQEDVQAFAGDIQRIPEADYSAAAVVCNVQEMLEQFNCSLILLCLHL